MAERARGDQVSVMMPMVFCASLVPWASETSEAEAVWLPAGEDRAMLTW
jgi:hypothetical protein